MVHEDAGQLVSDGTTEQDGCHAAVHTSREAEDNTVGAYLLTQLGNCRLHEVGWRPVLTSAADIHHKVLQQQCALQRMEHLWMELHAPNGLPIGSVCCILHLLRAGDSMEAIGQGCDGVAVAHPDLAVFVEALEERVIEIYGGEVGTTIFATSCWFHLATQGVAHELCTIADAQDRHAASELAQIHAESLGVIDDVRATFQDDADNIGVANREFFVGQYLADCVKLAQTACNELGGLRTEVENDNLLSLHILLPIHNV